MIESILEITLCMGPEETVWLNPTAIATVRDDDPTYCRVTLIGSPYMYRIYLPGSEVRAIIAKR